MTKNMESDSLAENEREEFSRRVSLVHTAMQNLLLSPRQSDITVERMINLLTLMVQESIFVFIYRRTQSTRAPKYEYVEYFDFDHAKSKRNVIALCRLSDTPGLDGESKLEEVADIKASLPQRDVRRLYQIGTSSYYLRVFRLADDDATTRFVEIPSDRAIRVSSQRSFKSRAAYDRVERYRVDIERYVRLCVHSFVGTPRESSSKRAVATRFAARMAECLDVIIEAKKEKKENADALTNLLRKVEVEKKDDPVHACLSALRMPSIMLGRTHERLKRVSIDATKLSDAPKNRSSRSPTNTPDAIANFFVSLRTYDRTKNRCDQSIDTTERDYNIQYVVPKNQVDEMTVWLKRNEQFLCQDTELYGSWLQKNQVRYPEHKYIAALIERLHKEFWSRLTHEKDFLTQLFAKPVGNQAISFVEPVFAGGLVHFRHPFRRMAGLARIAHVWKATQEGRAVEFDGLSVDDQDDALRTVAMFYITRAMAGRGSDQRPSLRTKVILVPLTVAGAVCGVIGAAVLEPHHDKDEDRTKHYVTRLGEEATRLWDAIWHLNQDVFVAVERDLRRYIRDLQIDSIQEDLTDCLVEQLQYSVDEEYVYPRVAEKRIQECNQRSDELARVAPYPRVVASWLGRRQPKDDLGVSLRASGTVGVELRHEPNLYFGPSSQEHRYGIVDLNYVCWRLQSSLLSAIHTRVAARQIIAQAQRQQ